MARRAGLGTRRYGHYVEGKWRVPYVQLVRLARVLETTPNYLMGFEGIPRPAPGRAPGRAQWLARLHAAATVLEDDDLELAVRRIEVLIANRRQTAPVPAHEKEEEDE